MGYSQEYHVERYLREVLVPRIGASSDPRMPVVRPYADLTP